MIFEYQSVFVAAKKNLDRATSVRDDSVHNHPNRSS
jgi:hypothetical protein